MSSIFRRSVLLGVVILALGGWSGLMVPGCQTTGDGDGDDGPGSPAIGEEGGQCLEGGSCNGDLVCNADTQICEGAGGDGEGEPALPGKTISFDLIGVHDPASDSYNANCIGCHGDRLDEVALDGVTPAAHATMAGLFGGGNDRCIACHSESGPNFLTSSSGGIRKQAGLEAVGCAGCHGPDAAQAFYVE